MFSLISNFSGICASPFCLAENLFCGSRKGAMDPVPNDITETYNLLPSTYPLTFIFGPTICLSFPVSVF